MQRTLFPHNFYRMFLVKKRNVTSLGVFEAWLWRRWQSWAE
jgi:hypothetical protein